MKAPYMTDKLYPLKQFEQDLETIRNLKASHESKIEKGNALKHIYYNQNNPKIVKPSHIDDIRENILKEDK